MYLQNARVQEEPWKMFKKKSLNMIYMYQPVCIQVNVQYDGKFNICRKDVLLKNVRLLILLCYYLLGRWKLGQKLKTAPKVWAG